MTDTLRKFIDENGLSVTAEFVPFSRSRNKSKPDRSLNWRVTLHHNGRAILTTDYMAGIAHCPAYKATGMNAWNNRETTEQREAIQHETETGRTYSFGANWHSAPIMPNTADVIYSLASDSDALDYATFEQWADEFGYDTDSRSAEATYRACLAIALQLRNGLGDDRLTALRNATQDY